MQSGICVLKEEIESQETELLSLLYALKEKLNANSELRKIATSTQEQIQKLQTDICTLEEELREQAIEQQTTLLLLKENETGLRQTKVQLSDEWYANIHVAHALQDTYKSISWRITAPLRFVGGLVIATGQLTANIWQTLKLKLRSFSVNKRVAVETDIKTSAKEIIENKAFQVNEDEHQMTVATGINDEKSPAVAVESQEHESNEGKDGIIATLETETEELTAEVHSDLSNNSSYLTPRATQTLLMLKVTEKKYSEKH